MKRKRMPIAEKRKKQRIIQQRYYAKLRAKGYKPVQFWLTEDEEKNFRLVLAKKREMESAQN